MNLLQKVLKSYLHYRFFWVTCSTKNFWLDLFDDLSNFGNILSYLLTIVIIFSDHLSNELLNNYVKFRLNQLGDYFAHVYCAGILHFNFGALVNYIHDKFTNLISGLFLELIAHALEVESAYHVHVFLKFDSILPEYFLKTLGTLSYEIGSHIGGRQTQVEVCVYFGDLQFQQLLLLS